MNVKTTAFIQEDEIQNMGMTSSLCIQAQTWHEATVNPGENSRKDKGESIRDFKEQIKEEKVKQTESCKELKKFNENKTQRSQQTEAERFKRLHEAYNGLVSMDDLKPAFERRQNSLYNVISFYQPKTK